MCGALSALISFPVHAEGETSSKIAQALSTLYGAPVEVEIKDENCKISYPEVTVEEEQVEYKPSPTDENEMTVETKTVTSTIPATTPICKKIGDFAGKPQYKITNDSPNKILAQFYNFTSFAFFKDIEIKNFSEETTIVPELGLISADTMRIGDAVYVQKDPTTGLKNELGNLKEFNYSQKVEQDKDKLKYRVDATIDTLNIASPLVSVQVKSEQQAALFEYKVSPDGEFDYTQGIQNLKNFIGSQSRALAKGIKINVDFMNAGLVFDIDMKGDIRLNKDNEFDIISKTVINNISFSGNMIEKNKQPRAILIKYSMNNINLVRLLDFINIQQAAMESETTPDSSKYDAEFAEIMDDIMEKALLKMEFKIKFSNAEISGVFDMKRENDYLTGTGKVSVNNLFGIFPEQKACLSDPLSEEKPECQDPIFLGLQEVIDITQNNSVNVYKYNQNGVFKNNEKIGEAVELNFKKMMQKQQELSKQQQEDEELEQVLQGLKEDE